MMIFIGALIAGAGWLYLIIGPGKDGLINLQMLSIANNIILLGYAIALWGVIEESSQKIANRISGDESITNTRLNGSKLLSNDKARAKNEQKSNVKDEAIRERAMRERMSINKKN